MKRNNFIFGLLGVLALGVYCNNTYTEFNFEEMAKSDVESLAKCEAVYDNEVVGSCDGEGTCTIPYEADKEVDGPFGKMTVHVKGTISCSGKKQS